jgi:hypothetical protein
MRGKMHAAQLRVGACAVPPHAAVMRDLPRCCSSIRTSSTPSSVACPCWLHKHHHMAPHLCSCLPLACLIPDMQASPPESSPASFVPGPRNVAKLDGIAISYIRSAAHANNMVLDLASAPYPPIPKQVIGSCMLRTAVEGARQQE